MKEQEDYGYERVRVVMDSGAGYGEFGCDLTINVDGDVLCVVNEGFEGLKGVADEGWIMLVWGRGRLAVGRVK